MSYEVTRDLIGRFHEGQFFMNFKQMCVDVGLCELNKNALGGNAKAKFLRDLSVYVDLEKHPIYSTAFIVRKVRDFDSVKRPLAGGNKRSEIFQRVLAHRLATYRKDRRVQSDDPVAILWTNNSVFVSCNLINDNFNYQGWLPTFKRNGIRYDVVSAFKLAAKNVMGQYIDSALNALQDKELISWTKTNVFVKKNISFRMGDYSIMVELNEDQQKEYDMMVEGLAGTYKMGNGLPCTSESDIRASKNSGDFYKTLRAMVSKRFNCYMILPAYKIDIFDDIIKWSDTSEDTYRFSDDIVDVNRIVTEAIPKLSFLREQCFSNKKLKINTDGTTTQVEKDEADIVKDQEILELISDTILAMPQAAIDKMKECGAPGGYGMCNADLHDKLRRQSQRISFLMDLPDIPEV